MTQLDQELSVDGPPAARRFAAVYQLLSVSRNQRLRMRVFADDAELLQTVARDKNKPYPFQ